jgi:RNA polymerase sigma factor (sigma-70 family)
LPDGIHGQIHDDWADSDADRGLTALYNTHYRWLVSLTALLVPDAATAEHVVQDSFVAMHSAWNRLGDGDHAIDYLLRSVVRRSRRVPRHGTAAHAIEAAPAGKSPAAQATHTWTHRFALGSALHDLPARQREVLVLRYYADLPDARIASALRITTGAVGRLAARALAALHAELRSADD